MLCRPAQNMDKIKQVLAPFRVPIIIVIVLIIAFLVFKGIGGSNDSVDEESPITSITAINDKEYSTLDDLDIGDFSIYAVHENGDEESLSTDVCELNTDSAIPIGETTTVVISWVGTEEEPVDTVLSCEAEVTVKREKILGIQCGYPELTNVTAVYYSNGELCFEGEGDIMTFDEGEAPWMNLDDDSITIRAISFDEGVTPTNLNYYFEGIETLTYCDTIPSSVKTMIQTFADCTALTKTADWTGCDELLNISGCYSYCTALTGTSAIPSNVRVAQNTFEDCTSLLATPDMSGADSLTDTTSMFSGCSNLVDVTMCPNVSVIESMFDSCINLKDMPELPSTVTNMTSAFNRCLSLTNLTTIPAGVESMGGAFSECEIISGELKINTECEDYSGLFEGAALATKVNLTGSSRYLDVYANTCDSGNVTVNGETADPALVEYSDVEEAEAAAAEEAAADEAAAEEEALAEEAAAEEAAEAESVEE